MSGLFNKKFTSQQDIQEGQVPDDLSDQPAPIPQITHPRQPQTQIPRHDEDQFIFETLPDNHFESDYPNRQKNNHKPQDYYPSNQLSQKKDRDRQYRNERDKRDDKNLSQKHSHKKQTYIQDNKRKSQSRADPQMGPSLIAQVHPPSIGYYPGIAPPPQIVNPYNPAYYSPYGAIPPTQPNTRPPYGVYAQLHHQPPPGFFTPSPHQNLYPVQNPNIYQIPPPPIAYGAMQPVIQPIPQELYHPQMMQPIRPLNDQGKNYSYDQQRPYQENVGYNHQKPQKQYQNRDRQDQHSRNFKEKQPENRYPEQRERSRDKKDHYDYETTKSEQKQKYQDKQGQYDQSYKERSRDQYSYNDKKSSVRQHKKIQQDQDKLKLKTNINEQLKIIFAENQQQKEEFLLVSRDVIKYRLLKKEEDEIEKFNGFQMARPAPLYSLNKKIIESNYEKALLKLENILITLAQVEAKTQGQSSSGDKKDALVLILTSLQIEDIVSKVKEMRLKKKLLGERKMSEIKKILQELVKDPRKRIK